MAGLEARVLTGFSITLTSQRQLLILLVGSPAIGWRITCREPPSGSESGRKFLVLSQGAWSCQRSVRWEDYLYMRTCMTVCGHWNEEMLFDIASDPHEQDDLFSSSDELIAHGRSVLADWTASQLERGYSSVDPMEIVLEEGGPFHTRGHLPEYIKRLRSTGRSHWADVLENRHPTEL